MIFRTLGKTGLKVSIVGFGASPLGKEFGDIDPEDGRRAVHFAIDHGINYFDVSPYYGRTLAETNLGNFLEGRRDEIILATKTGRYDESLETGFDFSAGRVASSLEESLQRLRTDRIDVLQAHDIEFGHKEQIINETLPAMQKLKEQGKVRFIGITGYPLRYLAEVAEAFEIDTILTYCRYNLMDTAMDDVLTTMVEDKNIGLINASPLHMRILSERGAPDWHPASREVMAVAEKAAEHCRAKGVDISKLAMQFVLAHPSVATTLVGTSKTRHVETNIKQVGVEPDPQLLTEVLEIIRPVANYCWRTGRSENDDPDAHAART